LGQNASYWITDIKEFKGESSVSIRKNKKIVTYDYQVKMSWELMINENSEIKGEIFFPEISNDVIDDDEEWEARVSITIGSDKVTKFINELIKK